MSISIKTRLKISSIVMLATVVVVGFILSLGTQKAYFASRAIEVEREQKYPDFFGKVVAAFKERDLKQWAADFNIDRVVSEANAKNGQYAKNALQVTVYNGRIPLTDKPLELDVNVANLVFGKSGEHVLIVDNLALYVNELNGHKVILSYSRISPRIFVYDGMKEIYKIITIVSTMLLAMLIVNLFLLRFVAQPIRQALSSLVGGVRQIQQGNFDIQIDYKGSDEFSGICAEFNKMARELQTAVHKIEQEIQNRRELLAGISHDLRTPLTSIKAYVEGLQRGVANTPEKREQYLETIKNKSDELDRLIERLFLFSKLNVRTMPLELTLADLGAEVAQIVQSVRADYEKAGLTIEMAHEPPEVMADIDRTLLQTMLVNIFENSLKYKNKEHGHLEIKMEVCGGQVKLTMTDDGPGVPDENLAQIFDVFYRCDQVRSNTAEGSGLGLAITAKIVTRQGGHIWAENVSGGGLAIIMTFPIKMEGVNA